MPNAYEALRITKWTNGNNFQVTSSFKKSPVESPNCGMWKNDRGGMTRIRAPLTTMIRWRQSPTKNHSFVHETRVWNRCFAKRSRHPQRGKETFLHQKGRREGFENHFIKQNHYLFGPPGPNVVCKCLKTSLKTRVESGDVNPNLLGWDTYNQINKGPYLLFPLFNWSFLKLFHIGA